MGSVVQRTPVPPEDREEPDDFALTDGEIAQLEREAVEEVSAVALRHANRLPDRSAKKRLFRRIAQLRLGLDDPDESSQQPVTNSLSDPGDGASAVEDTASEPDWNASELEALGSLGAHLEATRDKLASNNPWRDACGEFAQNLAQTLARHVEPADEPREQVEGGQS